MKESTMCGVRWLLILATVSSTVTTGTPCSRDPNRCTHGQLCSDVCTCDSGWIGSRCDIEICSTCDTKTEVCSDDGTKCLCKPGYVAVANKCIVDCSQCKQEDNYLCTESTNTCECLPGYKLSDKKCEADCKVSCTSPAYRCDAERNTCHCEALHIRDQLTGVCERCNSSDCVHGCMTNGNCDCQHPWAGEKCDFINCDLCESKEHYQCYPDQNICDCATEYKLDEDRCVFNCELCKSDEHYQCNTDQTACDCTTGYIIDADKCVENKPEDPNSVEGNPSENKDSTQVPDSTDLPDSNELTDTSETDDSKTNEARKYNSNQDEDSDDDDKQAGKLPTYRHPISYILIGTVLGVIGCLIYSSRRKVKHFVTAHVMKKSSDEELITVHSMDADQDKHALKSVDFQLGYLSTDVKHYDDTAPLLSSYYKQ
ncbi:multiple epidermal growth factor-like domains protein 10 isoform X5 [Watersipora subatra]|uniref:multiple epidermal growth factor-like domains protein 10 isoform X5 n=1 Tax=Watersipora subatra TaxID=2589382 RepID=UPI00355C95DA